MTWFVLDLPVPKSVNRLRKVDWQASRGIKSWTAKADALVLAARCRSRDPIRFAPARRFELAITISETHTRIDLDNGLKHIIDYLKRIEAIVDDGPKHMRKLTVEWGTAPEGCRVAIRPWVAA